MAATLASTLLGFFREVVNAKYYGTTWQMDTFLVAGMIPTILFGVFNGALVSVLVPTFSEYLATGDEASAWRLANTVINILVISVSLCAIIGYVAAPFYVPIIAHGFPQYQLVEAERMTRWLMTSIVALSLSGVLGAMLNAYHRFRSAALVVGPRFECFYNWVRAALQQNVGHLRSGNRHDAGIYRAVRGATSPPSSALADTALRWICGILASRVCGRCSCRSSSVRPPGRPHYSSTATLLRRCHRGTWGQ